MPTALITGASSGLGRAVAAGLARDGWQVVVTARGANRLHGAARAIGPRAHPVVGDVTDQGHRAELVRVVDDLGGLALLVNNASTLGPTPLPSLARLDPVDLDDLWLTNVAAPLALAQCVLPQLCASGGTLVGISSDAAVEHYPGWGGYAATKAALDHLTLTLGAENPDLRAYAVDPGDMRTAMHQAAFPGEDISDRPLPEEAADAVLALLRSRPPTGRYRAADFAVEASGGAVALDPSTTGVAASR